MDFLNDIIYHAHRLYRIVDKRLKLNSPYPLSITDKDLNEVLIKAILSGKPLFVGRYGGIETQPITTTLFKSEKNIFKKLHLLKQAICPIHTKQSRMKLQINAGFFPPTEENINTFAELILKDSLDLDYLASVGDIPVTRNFEKVILNHLQIKPPAFSHICLFPWITSKENFWTTALKNKKVLIVYPLEKSIHKQYAKREKLFPNTDFLPEFKLLTLKAVESHANQHLNCGFSNWFEALDFMKAKVDSMDFDIALLGCGSYGFPLAAHIKRKGKQAIYTGSSVQLFFGIKGKRWDEKFLAEYGLGNASWTSPLPEEIPKDKHLVEDGCYW